MNRKFRKCDKCPLLLIYWIFLVEIRLIFKIVAYWRFILLLINVENGLFILTIHYQNDRDAQKVTAAGTQSPKMKSQI